MEIENHGNQDRKAAQIFQDLQKGPIAEQESNPLKGPFNDEEKHHPGMPEAALLFAPRPGALPALTCDHDLEILRFRRNFGLLFGKSGNDLTTCPPSSGITMVGC